MLMSFLHKKNSLFCCGNFHKIEAIPVTCDVGPKLDLLLSAVIGTADIVMVQRINLIY